MAEVVSAVAGQHVERRAQRDGAGGDLAGQRGALDVLHHQVGRRLRGDAAVEQRLTQGINIVDAVGKVAEVAAAIVVLRVPVVGELDLRVLIARRCEKNQSKTALLVVIPFEFDEPQLVTVEVERRVDIADPSKL